MAPEQTQESLSVQSVLSRSEQEGCDGAPARKESCRSALRRQRRQRAALRRDSGCAPTPAETHQTVSVQERPVTQPLDVEHARFAELSANLDAGGDARTAALDEVRGHVREFSLDLVACRLVQKALSVASRSEANALVAELHGSVRVAIASPAGNYVIQKVVEVMPMTSIEFISAELEGVAVDMARHQYGCRVLCRMMEHHPGGTDSTERLFDEVLQDSAALCCHCYGHHVIESVLEHGTCDQKHRIAVALQGDLFRNAKNRFASYVLRKALVFCTFAVQQEMANSLLNDVQKLSSIIENQNGCFVVKTLLRLPRERLEPALSMVQEHQTPDASSTRARRVWRDLRELEAVN